jgi:hypothetical protein
MFPQNCDKPDKVNIMSNQAYVIMSLCFRVSQIIAWKPDMVLSIESTARGSTFVLILKENNLIYGLVIYINMV